MPIIKPDHGKELNRLMMDVNRDFYFTDAYNEPIRFDLKMAEGVIPQTEEECIFFYQQKIKRTHENELTPLMEDLADWINNSLSIDYLNATNLLDLLDNGVILCHLAQIIKDKIKDAIDAGTAIGPVPLIKGPFFEKAMRHSFHSRDNMEKFIKFCRQLGVHENLLFETNDLVLQNQPRNVILCLMEVARIASKYNLKPPGLILFEKEIADQEQMSDWQLKPQADVKSRSSATDICEKSTTKKMNFIQEGSCGVGDTLRRAESELIICGASDGVRSESTEEEWSPGSSEDTSQATDQGQQALNDMDLRVKQVTRSIQKQCHCLGGKCEKLKVKKAGEGKYNIAGRNVLIRLLKGRHMMVRVGGGWDTLEHFLKKHDPCQAKGMSRPTTPAVKPPRPYSALNSYDTHTPTPSTRS